MEMTTKVNGWAGIGCNATTTATVNSVPIYSKYTRCTELRRVDDNDIYKLATILDVNGCWRKLMSIIPKRLDAQACSVPGGLNYAEIAGKVGLKYTTQQISLIDGTAERLTPGQSISQVMIDEWKTSGKLNERPTVGVLLQLLVHAEIYSAADFVALHFLNEPKPDRPTDGPAAHISLDLCSEDLNDEDMMDVDDGASSYQPNTSALHAAAEQVRSTGMNLDYFDKHMVRRDKSVPQQSENNSGGSGGAATPPPVAPPRSIRSSRQLKTTASNAAATTTTRTPTTTTTATTVASSASGATNTPNMPMLSILNASSEQLQQTQQNIPYLSILNGDFKEQHPPEATTTATATAATTSSTATTIPNVPLITLLIENASCEISNNSGASNETTTATTKTAADVGNNSLPAISALNLNTGLVVGNGTGEHHSSSSTNSFSNDEDEDEDDEDDHDSDVDSDEAEDVSLPNLSNSEHQTSNNDSSLTTVTGTSGENSFELTNDSSSASNDIDNIPNLSELQPQPQQQQ
ncbi:protein Tube [Drosophila grimshawi]|uniref:GH14077 n=1 Tax=Drosophila grimshawi TaxID=7222 RepID=B4JY63_DROGR|nr:protein Tube [Drosophila grimshawi]EDV90625.1 GH14077 [Drosophila grimshawi]